MSAPATLTRLTESFWKGVQIGSNDDCWPWTRCLDAKGYGRCRVGPLLDGPAVWNSHRLAYVLTKGPILTGAELDHVCHTEDPECPAGAACLHRRCCNPNHLQPVTHLENALRREARKAHCKRGHAFQGRRGPNGVSTRCRECHRVKMRHFRETGIYAWPNKETTN